MPSAGMMARRLCEGGRIYACTVASAGLAACGFRAAAGPRRSLGSVAPLPEAIVFVLGGPGSGKGTVCRLATERWARGEGVLASCNGWSFDTCSAGQLLRDEAERDSEAGAVIRETLRQGRIVDGCVTLPLLRERMEEMEGGRTCFLIDGFPRTLEQAKAFEDAIKPCSLAVHLVVDDWNVLEERLLGRARLAGKQARDDDNLASIRQRFRVHQELCQPVVEYYRAKGLVREVGAVSDAAKVTAAVEKEISEHLHSSH